MFWGKQRSTSSPLRLCCSSFSVSVPNFATSPNSGGKFFGGFLRSEKSILRFIFSGCASFSSFFFLLLRSRDARARSCVYVYEMMSPKVQHAVRVSGGVGHEEPRRRPSEHAASRPLEGGCPCINAAPRELLEAPIVSCPIRGQTLVVRRPVEGKAKSEERRSQ